MNKWVVIDLLVWLLNYWVVIEHIELTKKYLPLLSLPGAVASLFELRGIGGNDLPNVEVIRVKKYNTL